MTIPLPKLLREAVLVILFVGIMLVILSPWLIVLAGWIFGAGLPRS